MISNITAPTNIGLNKTNAFGLNLSITKTNSSVYYAKKGEPMYIKEMDSDEDGIIDFDEFKEYCQANNISPRQMVQMLQVRMAYLMNKKREKAEKSKKEDGENTTNTEFVYAKEGDAKYDEKMDYNSDGKVTYKEYAEYCREHSNNKQEKSDTIIDKNSEDFKIINTGEALNSYIESEMPVLESKIECVA